MDHTAALVLSGLNLVQSHAFAHSFAQNLSSSSLPSSAKERLYSGTVSHGRCQDSKQVEKQMTAYCPPILPTD